jgi:hypothetical protein
VSSFPEVRGCIFARNTCRYLPGPQLTAICPENWESRRLNHVGLYGMLQGYLTFTCSYETKESRARGIVLASGWRMRGGKGKLCVCVWGGGKSPNEVLKYVHRTWCVYTKCMGFCQIIALYHTTRAETFERVVSVHVYSTCVSKCSCYFRWKWGQEIRIAHAQTCVRLKQRSFPLRIWMY